MRYFFVIYFLLTKTVLLAQVRTKGYMEPVVTSSEIENTYAIVVGVSKYSDKTIPELRFAHKDAEDFKFFLMSAAGGAVPVENIEFFSDSTATFAAIDIAFKNLRKRSFTPKSKFIFFFSTHGIRDNQNEVILRTYDYVDKQISFGISINYLKKEAFSLLERNENITIQIYIDACLSGEITSEPFSVIDELEIGQVRNLKKRSFWFASSDFDESSHEDDSLNNGLFTHYLIRGLKGMADTKIIDKKVSSDELSRYVKDSVVAYLSKRKIQSPQHWGNEELEVAIVHVPTLAALKNEKGILKSPPMDLVDSVILNSGAKAQRIYKNFKLNLKVFEFRKQAISQFEELSKLKLPNQIKILLKIQLLKALTKSSEDILSAYIKNSKNELNQSDIIINISHLEYACGEFGKTEKQYQILMARKVFFEGLLSKLKKDTLKAEGKFREAIKLDSTAAYAYNELGVILIDKSNYNEAIKIFNKGLVYQPDWLFLKNNYGVALALNNFKDEAAIKAFENSIKQNPNEQVSYLNMGLIFAKNLKREKAIENFENEFKVGRRTSQSNWLETDWQIRQTAINKYEEIASKNGNNEKFISKSFYFTNVNRYERDNYFYQNNQVSPRVDSRAYKYSQQANKLFDKELYDEAILYYNKAVKFDVEDYKSYYNIGIAIQESWAYDDTLALEAFDKVLSVKPDFAKAYTSKGHVLLDLGRIDDAIECYSNVILLEPMNYFAYGYKGGALVDKKSYQEAIECYQKSIAIKPDYAAALYDYGTLLYKLDSLESAIKYYDKIILCSRGNLRNLADVFCSKGNVLSKLGAYEQSIACYDSAIVLNSRNSYAFNNKGASLSDLKKYREAISCYEQAIKIDSLDAMFFNNKGYAQFRLGDYIEAINSFDRATFLKRDYALAFYNKGNAFASLEKYPEAIENYKIAIGINPEFAQVYRGMGRALQKRELYNEAISSFDKAIELDTTDYFAHLFKGTAMVDMECYNEAISSFDKAISLNPTYDKAFFLKGLVFKAIDKNHEALLAFEKVIALDPSNSSVYYEKASLLLNLKRYNDALPVFEKAIKISYKNAEATTLYIITLIACQKFKEAKKNVDRLLAKDSHNYIANFAKGLILAGQGKFKRALVFFDRALLIDSCYAMPFLMKGLILFDLERYEEVISLLKRASSTTVNDDDLSILHLKMGDAFRLQRRYREAIEHYDFAISLDARHYEAYEGKAHALYLNAKYEESLVAIDKAIAIKPDAYEAYFHKSLICLKLKNYEVSLESCDRVIKIKKNHKAVHNNRGYALRKLARPEAITVFNEIIAKGLDTYLTYYNLACLYASQNKVEDALASMKKALKKGYRNFKEINEESNLDSIRNLPDFVQLIKRYRK